MGYGGQTRGRVMMARLIEIWVMVARLVSIWVTMARLMEI